MALITHLLIKTGLMRGSEAAPAEEPQTDAASQPLVVHVEDLEPATLAQMEADGLVHLDDSYVGPLDDEPHKTRVIHLDALVTHSVLDQSETKVEADLADTLGLNATLADVLSTSKLQAQPGEWNIDRALHWLNENRQNFTTMGELSRAFKEALASAQISESRVLSDAALRDRAIDKYEFLLKKRIETELNTLSVKESGLSQRIAALTKEVDAIKRQQRELTDGLERWCANKSATEEQWAGVINLLIPGAGNTLLGNATREEQ